LSSETDTSDPVEWLKAGGVVITSAAILLELKLGAGAPLLEELALRRVANAMAAQRGIVSSEEQLDKALATFYVERNLLNHQQIADWLRSVHLHEASLRDYVREKILFERLRESLISDELVEKRFGMNPHEYARAEVQIFTFSTEGAAREFILAVHEQETQPIHGARRWLIRRETPEEASALIFSGEPEAIVGPVETDYQCYEVYRLLHRESGVLDTRLRRQLRNELFAERLKAELSRDPITFLL
jgi:hypothetical protein